MFGRHCACVAERFIGKEIYINMVVPIHIFVEAISSQCNHFIRKGKLDKGKDQD